MAITAYSIFRSTTDITVTVTSSLAAPDVTVYYHWYLDGAYVGFGISAARAFQIPPGSQFDVTVVDTLDAGFDPIGGAPDGFSARRAVYWLASAFEDVARYRVEGRQSVIGTWAVVGVVTAVAGQWQYSVDTERLPDRQRWEFRVIPVDSAGNSQDPVPVFDQYVVRNPDAPEFTVSVDTDQTLIFTEVT